MTPLLRIVVTRKPKADKRPRPLVVLGPVPRIVPHERREPAGGLGA